MASTSIFSVSQDPYVTVFILLAAILMYKLIQSKSRTKTSPPLPPGPRGLPIIGNLPFLNSDALHTQFQSLTTKFGPLIKLKLGSKLAIVVSSPEMAQEVLKTHDVIFANHDLPEVGKINTYGGEDILWSPYGSHWRRMRKLCVMKMFTTPSLEASYSIRREETRGTVVYMSEMAMSEVNLGEQIFLSIFNVVTRMMWGATVEGEERTSLGNELKKLISDISDIEGIQNYSDFFPVFARFDFQGLVKKMRVHVEKLDVLFDRVMENHVKMVERKSEEEEEEDFLQYVLRVKDDDEKAPLSMTHVKSLLMDMVLGGVDTSVNAAEFGMAEVLSRPEVLKSVQKELDQVVGRENVVEESHIPNLLYLQAIMKETLRIHPTLPLLVPHRNSETSVVAGYTIPKDSKIFINVWAIHRDSKNWEDPYEFKPERFLDSSFDFNGNDYKYLPFGSGRRICAAINMAERLVLYNLASFLHSFDWEAPKGERFEVEEKFGLVLKLKKPLIAIPIPRLSEPNLYSLIP